MACTRRSRLQACSHATCCWLSQQPWGFLSSHASLCGQRASLLAGSRTSLREGRVAIATSCLSLFCSLVMLKERNHTPFSTSPKGRKTRKVANGTHVIVKGPLLPWFTYADGQRARAEAANRTHVEGHCCHAALMLMEKCTRTNHWGQQQACAACTTAELKLAARRPACFDRPVTTLARDRCPWMGVWSCSEKASVRSARVRT